MRRRISRFSRQEYLCVLVGPFINRGDLFDYKVNYLMYEFTARGCVKSDLDILDYKNERRLVLKRRSVFGFKTAGLTFQILKRFWRF